MNAEELPRYCPNRACAKCGSTQQKAKWRKEVTEEQAAERANQNSLTGRLMATALAGLPSTAGPEHIAVTCGFCGHVRRERCHDQEDEG